MNESERLLPISTTFYPFLLISTLKTLCFQIFIKLFFANIAKYKVFSDDLLVTEVVTESVTDCNRLNMGTNCTLLELFLFLDELPPTVIVDEDEDKEQA